MSFRSFAMFPFAVLPVVADLVQAQASVQETTTISSHLFLGGRVTAYGGYVWPNMKASLKLDINWLTSPAVEAAAFTTRSTSPRAIPSCQTYIRINGTTRHSAQALGLTLLGAPTPTRSLSVSADAYNVLPGAGAQRTQSFGSAQVGLATNCAAYGTCSASFVLGSVHEMDNAELRVWAEGATTLLWNNGTIGVGVVSELHYGTHQARGDDAQHGPVLSQGTLSWTFGPVLLRERLMGGGHELLILDTSLVSGRSGARDWFQYFEG